MFSKRRGQLSETRSTRIPHSNNFSASLNALLLLYVGEGQKNLFQVSSFRPSQDLIIKNSVREESRQPVLFESMALEKFSILTDI